MGSRAYGIYVDYQQNITVRHCNVRGFWVGSRVDGNAHLIEDNRFNNSLSAGILVGGDASVVRRNQVTDTGGEVPSSGVEPYGIYSAGAVDIIDNNVSGVFAGEGGNGWVVGIVLAGSTGGTIQGNRVRGLVSYGFGEPIGIEVKDSLRVTLRSNDTIGSGIGIGVTCTGEFNRARDNVINGFPTPLGGCGDAGGNDLVGIP